MSGFAGLVLLDGDGSATARLAFAAPAVAHRGDEPPTAWGEDRVALLHAARHVTIDSRREAQPFVAPDLVVVADARIDHRDELLTRLELRAEAGDAAIIAAAWRRWGTRCAGYLEGDFAFALWDRGSRTLHCARDACGVRPLVYCHVPGRFFAFASEPRALLAIPGVPAAIDEKRLADFFSVRFDDFERTFHRDIRRLPGGCSLTLAESGAPRIDRYWSAGSLPPASPASDAEFAEGFLDHFSRAMRSRMRDQAPGEVGAMLSGGLDSSIITGFAARNLERQGGSPLAAFSWIFSDSMDADERHYQEVVASSLPVARHVLDSATAGYSPWSSLERLLPDGPPYAPNFYLNLGAGERARALGVKAILDGLGGDSTISRGSARLVELFTSGQLGALVKELRALTRVHGGTMTRVFLDGVVRPLAPAFVGSTVRKLRRKEQPPALLRPALAGLTTPAPRRRLLSTREEHIAQHDSPLMGEGLELFDRVMNLTGVEGRYPFFDRRLIEYCISLPGDQKLAGGYSRVVARRALDGVVPREVLWRAGKGKPGLHILKALADSRPRLDDLFVRDPSALDPYVSIDAARDLYRRFLGGQLDFGEVIQLWSLAAGCLWLRQVR